MILECIYPDLTSQRNSGIFLFPHPHTFFPICPQFIKVWCAKSLPILPQLIHSCSSWLQSSHLHLYPKFLNFSELIILFYTPFQFVLHKAVGIIVSKNLNHVMHLFKLFKSLQQFSIVLEIKSVILFFSSKLCTQLHFHS